MASLDAADVAELNDNEDLKDTSVVDATTGTVLEKMNEDDADVDHDVDDDDDDDDDSAADSLEDKDDVESDDNVRDGAAHFATSSERRTNLDLAESSDEEMDATPSRSRSSTAAAIKAATSRVSTATRHSILRAQTIAMRQARRQPHAALAQWLGWLWNTVTHHGAVGDAVRAMLAAPWGSKTDLDPATGQSSELGEGSSIMALLLRLYPLLPVFLCPHEYRVAMFALNSTVLFLQRMAVPAGMSVPLIKYFRVWRLSLAHICALVCSFPCWLPSVCFEIVDRYSHPSPTSVGRSVGCVAYA
jgi:hypothetical protein